MGIVAQLVGNPSILARRTEISRRTISLYLSGATDPSRERLIRLAEVAGVNLDWLATGNGPMRGERPHCRRDNKSDIRQECLFVPLCDQSIHPPGRKFEIKSCLLDYIPVNPLLIPGCHAQDGKHFFFRNRDVAMLPAIQPEDLVLVKIAPYQPGSNRLYVLFSQGLLQLRRILPLVGQEFMLTADNPLLAAQKIGHSALDQIDIVGAVIWAGKKF